MIWAVRRDGIAVMKIRRILKWTMGAIFIALVVAFVVAYVIPAGLPD